MLTAEIRYRLGRLEMVEPSYDDGYELVEVCFDQDSNLKVVYFYGANASSINNTEEVETTCIH
jgi:hypothetical protein|tara:strand:+ start:251 stop:439 length:189 start_codon:yes stop_codon:yes gene_type:complete